MVSIPDVRDSDATVSVHFSDFFEVSPDLLEEYGAFNISLVNDLPLFIDPFLLFNSDDPSYRELHDNIIQYLKFLRDKSLLGGIDSGGLKAWYTFSEVEQTWLGYSYVGNKGRGLGNNFATALDINLNTMFHDFGHEKITRGSHLEKLSLFSTGVGRDNISDFTTNLIKEFLLEYTQAFARNYIRPEYRKVVPVAKVRFNYSTETWEGGKYDLPFYDGAFVLLTPKDILTKDEIWISKDDLYNDYDHIVDSIANDQLRFQLNNYFTSLLPANPKEKEIREAIQALIRKFPQYVDHYIRYKEDNGDQAVATSSEKVIETQTLFVQNLYRLVRSLHESTPFYEQSGDTYEEAFARVRFLKDVIENKDGYRIFYLGGKQIKREEDLQLLYRLTWRATISDVNREVNNGRGPVDFKVSRGNKDKTLVEFKLASNTQLKRNLEKQVEIYEKASDTDRSIKVILYFSEAELEKVTRILNELNLRDQPNIVLIDARADNKPSASKA